MIRRLAVLFALAAALAATSAITWSITYKRALDQLQAKSSTRLVRAATTLQATLERYGPVPYLVASHPLVQDALAESSGTVAELANRYLEDITHRAQATVTYIITTDGLCIASSNWRQPSSFVGARYGFRPYFIDAIAGHTGHFFGIGAHSREPGYYLSQPVWRHGKQVGVVVVKINLSWFPPDDPSEPLVVTDQHGVIFLTSIPAWKYRTVRPLSTWAERQIRATRQYADEPLTPLPLSTVRALAPGAQLVRFSQDRLAPRYVQTACQLNRPSWRLMTLSALDDVDAQARAAASIAGCVFMITVLLAFYWRFRRARATEIEQSCTLLQKAYAELNQRIAERTTDLSAANRQLTNEIAERTRADAELHAAQDELVQASKLAALGQMAAGITHELNQPLTALRTFSDNTRVLLERGELDAARDNLEAIGSLTERMGRITNQLKLFVDKHGPRNARTQIAPALRNALTMLHSKLAGIAVGIARIGPNNAREPFNIDKHDTSLAVRCDDLRVEQVLINLIANAADAVAQCDTPRITIEIIAQPNAVVIKILDNGTGISPEALPRLFEPFFTTKEIGQGLGLGLAISASIVRDAGGTLTAQATQSEATAKPGACFVLTLPRAYALVDLPASP